MPFTLLAERRIPELDSLARLYRHDATGARLLSLANSDENKTFGVTFRTPPERSDGVAHIMEHSVLCGSDKYRVKEPFVELIKSSLNTFLNAMTYPDKTVYPVASANLKDFRNLVDVYMDAVFHPLITEDTFRQEGWHHEVDPETGELAYKGVVFNEMKGAWSDPENIHGDLSRRSLFPGTAYALDSGGDPDVIPTLDYATFKAFHETYYHPSNAFIYFYGDDDPDERLRYLDAWLAPYSRREVDSLPGLPEPFAAPVRSEVPYDTGDSPDAKSYVSVNWALPGHGDAVLSLGLAILSHILAGTPASPLRKALIESGLGEDLAGYGYMEDLRRLSYSTGLKGVSQGDEDKVESLVVATLERLSREGIDPDTVAASMNTVEFLLREKNTGRFPRGLAVMLDALNDWLYDGDPFAAISFEAPLAAVKARLATGERYFENLLRSHFLENPHRSTVVLRPDAREGARRAAREAESLAKARASMGPADLEAAGATARRLRELQERPDSPEALASIPSLNLDDLPAEPPHIPIQVMALDASGKGWAPVGKEWDAPMPADRAGAGPTLLFHDLPTGGVVYLDLCLDLARLDARLLPWAGILGRVLLEMGTDREDYVALSQRIGKHTGGIRASTFTATAHGTGRTMARFVLRGKALHSGVGPLLEIIGDVLARGRLDDRERFRQIVLESKAQSEASVVPAGHQVVATRLRSRFNEADAASERLSGLERLFFLRDLARRVDSDWQGIQADLAAVRSALVDGKSALFNVTTDAASFASLGPSIAAFAASLPSGAPALPSWIGSTGGPGSPAAGATNNPDASGAGAAAGAAPGAAASAAIPPEGLSAPTQVNYVGKAFALRGAGGYEPDGSTFVVNKHLDTGWLWEKIRVQGGAYGGFSSFDLATGVFALLSYRDPNLLGTIDVMDRTAAYLSEVDIDPDELRKSIIGTVGDMDAYLLPDSKGYSSMLHWIIGYTPERRLAVRRGMTGARAEDFRRMGKALAAAAGSAALCALGSADTLAKASEEGRLGLVMTKVL